MPRFAAGFVVWAALTGSADGASRDRDPARLRPGLFLYAAPGLQEPRFAETVVLLIEHGSKGSMGLVVNRRTDTPLHDALDERAAAGAADLRVYWGGPVQPEAIFALLRSTPASGEGRVVVPEVHVTGSLDDVRAALAERDPRRRLRVYSGYAGWGAGQLAAELRGGSWVLERADADAVFAPQPELLWRKVFRLLERLEARAPHAAALPGPYFVSFQTTSTSPRSGRRFEMSR